MLVALSLGVSVAFWPVVLLWFSVVGWDWSPVYTWVVVGAAAVTTVVGLARGGRPAVAAPHALALSLIVLIALGLRFRQAAPLVVPAWVDGLHHTEITLRIMEEDGLPHTLRPYMSLDSFYYHFGFHVLAALVAETGGIPAERAVLAIGQLLSALSCLSVYALARAARVRADAALIAAAVPASLYWFPMYFVTWSRFTQLAGLVVLPAAWILLARGLRRPTPANVSVAGMAAAGLVLVHYRVGVFYGLGVVAMLLLVAVKGRGLERQRVRRGLAGLAAAASIALLLSLPWLISNLMGGVRELSAATAPASTWFEAAPGTLDVPRWLFVQRWNAVLLAAGIAGLALAALRRSPAAEWLLATCLLATVVTSPDLIRLPSSWLVPGFSAAISLWLPVGVGIAFLASEAARVLTRRPRAGHRLTPQRLRLGLRSVAVLATLAGVLELSGGRLRVVQVLNASTIIAEAEDMEAARWIRENTPDSARFLVSSGHWHLGTYRGLDGGYWLPVTAGRSTTMPGGLYSFGDPDDVRAITSFAKRMEAGDALSDAQLKELMDEAGATYVYVGPAGADVAGKLTSARLSEASFLREVYATDGVHIFARR